MILRDVEFYKAQVGEHSYTFIDQHNEEQWKFVLELLNELGLQHEMCLDEDYGQEYYLHLIDYGLYIFVYGPLI